VANDLILSLNSSGAETKIVNHFLFDYSGRALTHNVVVHHGGAGRRPEAYSRGDARLWRTILGCHISLRS